MSLNFSSRAKRGETLLTTKYCQMTKVPFGRGVGGCGQSPIQWVKTLLSPRQLCEENRDWETFITTKKRDYENREIPRNNNFAKPMFLKDHLPPNIVYTCKNKGSERKGKMHFRASKKCVFRYLVSVLDKEKCRHDLDLLLLCYWLKNI